MKKITKRIVGWIMLVVMVLPLIPVDLIVHADTTDVSTVSKTFKFNSTVEMLNEDFADYQWKDTQKWYFDGNPTFDYVTGVAGNWTLQGKMKNSNEQAANDAYDALIDNLEKVGYKCSWNDDQNKMFHEEIDGFYTFAETAFTMSTTADNGKKNRFLYICRYNTNDGLFHNLLLTFDNCDYGADVANNNGTSFSYHYFETYAITLIDTIDDSLSDGTAIDSSLTSIGWHDMEVGMDKFIADLRKYATDAAANDDVSLAERFDKATEFTFVDDYFYGQVKVNRAVIKEYLEDDHSAYVGEIVDSTKDFEDIAFTKEETLAQIDNGGYEVAYLGCWKFDNQYLDWGGSNSATINAPASYYDKESIKTLVESIVSNRVSQYSNSVTVQSQVTADNMVGNLSGTTVGTIIEKYADAMSERLNEYSLEEYYAAMAENIDDSISSDTTWFQVFNHIAWYNLQYMVYRSNPNGINGNWSGVSEYNNQDIIYSVNDSLCTSGKITVFRMPKGTDCGYKGTALYGDYELISAEDIWDKLTPYEQSIIATTYQQQLKRFDGEFTSDVAIISKNIESGYNLNALCNNSVPSSNLQSIPDDGIHLANGDSLYTKVSETLKDWEDLGGVNETNSVLNTIRWCDFIGEYIVYTAAYGENTGEESSWADTTSTYNLYNADLASLSQRVTIHDQNELFYPLTMPSEMGLFGENSDQLLEFTKTDTTGNMSTSWDKLVNFLFNVSYGFDICAFSDAGEETGYTPMALYAALKGLMEQQ